MESKAGGFIRNNFIVSGIIGYFKNHYGPMIGLLAIGILIQSFQPMFFTILNFVNILRQISVYGVLALALSLIIMTGNIDLSIGSNVAASGCLVAVLYSQVNMPLWFACICTTIVGGCIGLFNGFMVTHTILPPFVITLATQMTIRGLAYLFTRGYPVIVRDETFSKIGNGAIQFGEGVGFEIPYSVIVMFVLFIIFGILLSRTKFGRHVYATGGNTEAAIHSGINVKTVRKLVYMFAGMLAAVAGIILASRMFSGQPTVGVGYEGEAIAASVLGGIRFGGGYGSLGGTIIGSFIMGVINNGLNMVKLDYYYQFIVKGVVILLAVYFDSAKETIQFKPWFLRGKKGGAQPEIDEGGDK